MYAVLAEDRTDADSLAELIKVILKSTNASIAKTGFSGCGELCRKAASHVLDFTIHHMPRFGRQRPRSEGKSGGNSKRRSPCPTLISLRKSQWKSSRPGSSLTSRPLRRRSILKIQAVAWPEAAHGTPRSCSSGNRKEAARAPLYVPAIFNPKVAKNISPEIVETKCPSFKEFADFIKNTSSC